MGTGRPTKLTDEIALGIAQGILDGNYRKVAAAKVGVPPRRLERWMAAGLKFPGGAYGVFRRLVLETEAEAERIAVAAVLEAGKTQDARHLEWWLERKFHARWGRHRGELAEVRRRLKELEGILRAAGHLPTPPAD